MVKYKDDTQKVRSVIQHRGALRLTFTGTVNKTPLNELDAKLITQRTSAVS